MSRQLKILFCNSPLPVATTIAVGDNDPLIFADGLSVRLFEPSIKFPPASISESITIVFPNKDLVPPPEIVRNW